MVSAYSLQDLTIYNPERTIIVKGSIEACCRAEVEIMRKLREAYENDITAINVSGCFFPENRYDSKSDFHLIWMLHFRCNDQYYTVEIHIEREKHWQAALNITEQL